MGCWLGLSAYQTVDKELGLLFHVVKKNNLKGNFARKKMEFYFQSNSVMNSLECPKSKSLSHCLTEIFPIYQNKP